MREEYIEEDTICVTCDYFSSCSVNKVDVTSMEDVKQHYLPDFGEICRRMEEKTDGEML